MKILIAEDDQTVQRAYKRMFRRTDHEVQVVGSPAEAFEMLKTFMPDVILSDWDMPGMNGGEFCKALREQGNQVPFFIVSGQVRIAQVLEVGATTSLLKPIDMNELNHAFEQYVA